jgi:hypothetical protein
MEVLFQNQLKRRSNSDDKTQQKTATTSASSETSSPANLPTNTVVVPSVALSEADLSKASATGEKVQNEQENNSESPEPDSVEKAAASIASDSQSTEVKNSTSESDPIKTALEVETEKLAQARDWVNVLDESIAELNTNKSKLNSAEKAKQLESFEKLKAEKLKEINVREAKIAELNSVNSQDIALSENDKLVLAESETDLNQLDASTLARLESKIDNASAEQKYLKIIANTQPEYSESLAEAELSGLSAPEISEKRIALNEQLIVALS